MFFAAVAYAASNIAAFNFITEPQTINPGEFSGSLTIQSQDASGEKVNTAETIDLEFSSASPTGEFLNSSGNPVSAVMSKGTANRTFYYRDSASGVFALNVKATGRESGESWTATQNITVGQAQSESQTSSSSEETYSGSESLGSVPLPPAPQIKIYAGENRVAVAGAEAKFEGTATGFKGEPLANADFLWNFGDGSIARGKTVFHAFIYPGEYSVDLNVSVGGASILDRAEVLVIPNAVSISEVKPGEEGWIELLNNSKWVLDLSRWGLSDSELIFYFPENTKILPLARVVISKSVSGLVFPVNGMASFFYPNASRASIFSYFGGLGAGESFHNIRGEARVGLESPGTERFVARSVPANPVLSAPAPSGQSPALAILASNKSAEEKEDIDYNLASAGDGLPETADFSDQPVFWFLSALGLGVVSAGGYLFIKRKGFL